MISIKRILIILCLMSLTFSCAANRIKLSGAKSQGNIPAGVDSLLALRAYSVANLHFVEYTQKKDATNYYNQSKKLFEMSDSLWQLYYKILVNTTGKDSISAAIFYQQCQSFLKIEDRKYQKDKLKLPEPHNIKSLAIDLCYKAKRYASQAKLANPFDLNVRVNLIQILIKLGKLLNEKTYYHQAITELQEFLNYDKSQDNIYSLLAECYYSLGDWKNAYENFHQAQYVLEQVAHFNEVEIKSPKLDTSKLVYYLQQQGDTKAKMYEDKTALQLLEISKKLTNSSQMQQQIQNYMDWINWDDGNIRASEKRDAIYDLCNQKKFKAANREFKKLLKLLKTQRARNQINWKIAAIDFKILNNKNKGIKRLFSVVKHVLTANSYDSSAIIYLNDYGAMCYSLGMDYLKMKKYKTAYAYFNQATKIDWKGQGESYLQLALLSQSDPDETIKNCHKLLEYNDQVSPKLLNQTYRILLDAYKRNGDFKLARKYYQLLNQDITLNTDN